jgi:hypothetical protein
MPLIKITKQVLEMGKPVDEGWYPAELLKINRSKSKKGDSVNVCPDFKLTDGTEKVLEGYPACCVLNDKNPSMFWPKYVKMVSSLLDRELKEDEEIDEESLYGKKLHIHITNSVYNGQIQNNIADFLPISADTTVHY